MALTTNYPNLRPTLLLDFANEEALDPRITFSRPTTATYYDNHTTAVAEQNLLTYSQVIGGTNWGNIGTVTTNASTAPDGTTTASLLYPPTTGTNRRTYNTAAYSGSGTFTLSIYAKANGINFIAFNSPSNGGIGVAWFDLSLGVVGTVSGGYTASITSVGSGWYRCVLATTQVGNFSVFPADTDNTLTATTSGTNGIYIWGAQLEQRSSVTAYTPTTTTAITNYIPVLQTAASGVARFDHNPTTGESLGLLIEEQRTNLLTYSSQFDNAAWTKSSVTVNTAADIAPDGTLTAQWLVGTAAGERVTQNATASGTTATLSVYVKATSLAGNWASLGTTLLLRNTTTATNLTSATFSGSTFTPSAGGTATLVGNGWYRVLISASSGITIGDTLTAYIYTDNTQGVSTNSTLLAWGAQLEAGSFATSYIPTVASQVTRSADNASMTGTNFSSWFNQAQGSFYGDALPIATSIATSKILGTTPVAVGSYMVMSSVGNASNNGWYNSGLGSLGTALSENKTALEYNSSTFYFAGSMNGGTIVSSSASDFKGTATALTIGLGNVSYMNGWIKKLAYYPQALTSIQLQSLTGS